jgi:uncharacterized SAM-binding protein YcdF (DUF218 family)
VAREEQRAPASGRRARWRRALLFASGAVLFALGACAFQRAGSWLMVADPLRPARAIVVLAGQLPFRAMEAAAGYRQGLAPEVWLTRNGLTSEEVALARLGIERPGEYVHSKQVLERLGVPSSAIAVLGPRTLNTADEVRAIASQLDAVGGKRVIVVTSKPHTRRVRVLWQKLVGSRLEALVHYAHSDPFDPERWWRSTPDAIAVTRECFGLLNARLDFPIESQRRER